MEHLGTIRGGHYVAYVRGAKIKGKQEKENEGCMWYHASDAYVRESSLEEVLRCEAYILFYEQLWNNSFSFMLLDVPSQGGGGGEGREREREKLRES